MGSTCTTYFNKEGNLKTMKQEICSTKSLTSLSRRYLTKKHNSLSKSDKILWVLNKPFYPQNLVWIENLKIDDGTYTGERKNDFRQGIGTQKYEDSCLYSGQWSQDKFNGYGKFIKVSNSETEVYEGQWKDGQMHG